MWRPGASCLDSSLAVRAGTSEAGRGCTAPSPVRLVREPLVNSAG
jgi:hypothetical protein